MMGARTEPDRPAAAQEDDMDPDTQDPRYDQWVEDAGRGSVADVHDWEDDLPSAGELATEWIAANLPAGHQAAFMRGYKDAADRDWAIGGPTCGGRLR